MTFFLETRLKGGMLSNQASLSSLLTLLHEHWAILRVEVETSSSANDEDSALGNMSSSPPR